MMGFVCIADAKAHLGELVEHAAGSETAQIMCHGKPVAPIFAAKAPCKRIDIAVLRATIAKMPMRAEPTGISIRRTGSAIWLVNAGRQGIDRAVGR